MRRFIPQRSNWNAIKSRIVKDHERVKMLTKISIDVNVRTGEVSFSLPDLGLSTKETIIEDYIWQEVKEELVSGQEVSKLTLHDPDDVFHFTANRRLAMIDKPFPINCVVRNLRQASRPANDTVIDRRQVFVFLDFRTFLNAYIPGVSANDFIIRAYQLGGHLDVMRIGRGNLESACCPR